MATEEKATAEDGGGKPGDLHRGPFNQWRAVPLPAQGAWQRLEDAYKVFREAAAQPQAVPGAHRMVDGMRRVLRLLAVDEEFREKVIKLADDHRLPRRPKGGNAPKAIRDQERWFLGVVAKAFAECADDAEAIARVGLVALPSAPDLLALCPKALPGMVVDRPPIGGIVPVVERSLFATPEALQAAVDDLAPEVNRAISLDRANGHPPDLRRVARAIVRHLGCRSKTANNLFRIKRD